MDEGKAELIHALDDHHKDLNKVRKLKGEVLRLQEALIALDRGKDHVTRHYVQDTIEALEKCFKSLDI